MKHFKRKKFKQTVIEFLEFLNIVDHTKRCTRSNTKIFLFLCGNQSLKFWSELETSQTHSLCHDFVCVKFKYHYVEVCSRICSYYLPSKIWEAKVEFCWKKKGFLRTNENLFSTGCFHKTFLFASVGVQSTIRRRMKIVVSEDFGTSSNLNLLFGLKLDQYDKFMKPTFWFSMNEGENSRL